MAQADITVLIRDFIKNLALIFPTFLLLFTIRGFFKSLVHKIMGDDTPARYGFLTLNPVQHADLFGTLAFSSILGILFFEQMTTLLALLLLLFVIFVFGSLGLQWHYIVPTDTSEFRNYKLGMLLSIITAPLSNFFLVALCLLAIKYAPALFGSQPVLFSFIRLIDLIIFFGILDFIPLPPFEASQLLPVFGGRRGEELLYRLEEYSLLIFFGIILFPGTSDILHNISFLLRSALLKLVW